MELRVPSGSLLAAGPDLRDPNFMHAVVLICNHTEQGAFGLVLNRPSTLSTRDLLADHPILGQLDVPVYLGGPVDHSTLQFVHSLPAEIPGGLPLGGSPAGPAGVPEELALGGELEALARVLARDRGAALSRVRLFLGYSGWSAGQLESELGQGAWLPAARFAGAAFEEHPLRAWKRTVRSIGEAGRGLEHLPPDVTWN